MSTRIEQRSADVHERAGDMVAAAVRELSGSIARQNEQLLNRCKQMMFEFGSTMKLESRNVGDGDVPDPVGMSTEASVSNGGRMLSAEGRQAYQAGSAVTGAADASVVGSTLLSVGTSLPVCPTVESSYTSAKAPAFTGPR